ncbi:MAG: hypothetical protein ACW99A_11345, partial [Candidatus Kariarchaeaceae archaeon]
SIPTTPSAPNLAAPVVPDMAATSTPAAGVPNLAVPQTAAPAVPNMAAAPAPAAGAPNLAAPAVPNMAAVPAPAVGAPNLSAVPVGGTDDPAAMLNALSQPPSLDAAPSATPSPGGPMGFDPAEALAGLKKAPVEEKASGGGPLGFDPKEALAGLKKAPVREKKTGGALGFDPKEALAGLKKTPRKDGAEVKESEDEEEDKPVSAEDMKSQLQARLKQAFKK